MNILVLTSIYPQNDDEKNIGVTPVVKYFAIEWVKAGHKVTVIHNASIYPKFVYIIPDILLKKINSKYGIIIPNRNQNKKLYNTSDGVVCYRIPMLKILPKTKHTNKQINNQFDEIINILNKDKFKPDVILGHWENPQIQLLPMLKEKYHVKTAIVLHKLSYIKQKRYIGWAKKHIKDIDVVGARSKSIANEAKQILSLNKSPFICFSGIPDKYFDETKYRMIEFSNKISNSYLFAGRLIKRKNVDVTISALKKVHEDNNFIFNIIGEGPEYKKLKKIIENNNLTNNVRLLGYKERDKVLDIMAQSEVFVMISDDETFGLVYIEAMSRGCIVVASKHGGMDGIIIDGYNGFLCTQGNENELTEICNNIKKMTLKEKEIISKNAIITASNFKDSEVARRYLNNVLEN